MCVKQVWQERSGTSVHLTSVFAAKMLLLLLKHLFFIACLRCLCGRTVDVLTSQERSSDPEHVTLTSHTVKQQNSSDETFFHWNTLSPVAQVLRYAKHVQLFWNVGSLMSINTSNAQERLLWSWLGGAAFGGVIVLGSGGKYRPLFGRAICSWKGIRWLSLCSLYSHQGQIPAGNI